MKTRVKRFEKFVFGRNGPEKTMHIVLQSAALNVIRSVVCHFPFPGLLLSCMRHALRWYAGMRRYEVVVDGHRWAYLAGGQGDVILFLHGFGADKDRFGTFLPGFTPHYLAVVPDLPGFGENTMMPSKSYDIAAQVRRLNRFVEAIGLCRFHLFGLSMGGVCGRILCQ